MTSVIEAFGLTKSYGRRRGIIDVGFEVREGEVFGFLGPNGAGKTTTIRTLLGLLRPSSGRATLFGVDAWSDAPRAHASISYVGSDPAYLGELTAAAQLDYVARLRRLPRGAWRPVAERFELDPTVPIKRLSRGNRQKVGVVQAFMGEAPLMILDEPTTGLDPVARQEVLGELMEVLTDDRRTILFSSQNTLDVEQISDQITFIDRGRIVDCGDKESFLDRWRRLRLEVPPGTALPSLPGTVAVAGSGRLTVVTTSRFDPAMPAAYRDAGATVHAVDTMSLEEIFVANVMRRREGVTV
jgi:ABC-2 type transport system ATP-binding protein